MSSLDSPASLTGFAQACRVSNHRGVIVLTGEQNQVERAALVLLSHLPVAHGGSLLCDWVADDLPRINTASQHYLRHVHKAKAARLLGSDLSQVVINAYDGLSPNLLGIVGGALKGGGLLLLLTPELQQWPKFDDPDYRRFTQNPQADGAAGQHLLGGFLCRFVKLLEESIALPCAEQPVIRLASGAKVLTWSNNSITHASLARAPKQINSVTVCEQSTVPNTPLRPTQGQQRVIEKIKSIARASAAALLITADRGRGKTTALGLAAASLLAEKADQSSLAALPVVLCAPIKTNVENAWRIVTNPPASEEQLSQLLYLPPDMLLEKLKQAQSQNRDFARLVIIDEAAAIALPVIEKIATLSPRIVFASTTAGYEGSGRGFILRFRALLQRRFALFEHLTLTDPVRWAPNDKVEQFFNRLLCLVEPVISTATPASDQVEITELCKSALLETTGLLEAVFAVLLNAHYQTRPDDLRYLLDTPYTRLWVARNTSGTVIGALLICEEGGLRSDPALLSHIASGKRRPRGNMLAQLLAYQANDPQWCRQLSWRVMRIAILPSYRRRGIAARLIRAMESAALARDCGYWGSLFGFDATLIAFWQNHKVFPVHLGLHRDKASAARNLAVLRLLPAGKAVLAPSAKLLASRLASNVPLMQKNYFTELSMSECEALCQWAKCTKLLHNNAVAVSQQDDDLSQLKRFLDGEVGIDSVFAASFRLLQNPAVKEVLGAPDKLLSLFMRHGPHWQTLVSNIPSQTIHGKKNLQRALRERLSELYAALRG